MNDALPIRHALGMPAGSVRALLTLIVVGLICATLLIPAREAPVPIPPYLIHLLYMMVGHYFASRGLSRSSDVKESGPLYLPTGCVRLIIIAALVGTVVWKYVNDRPGLEAQFTVSVEALKAQPFLAIIVLAGFFLGALVRMVLGRRDRSVALLNFEAWMSLIAVLLMCVAALIHLVINPSLAEPLDLPDWEGFLAAIVAFYFGERS
jgi:hypothetical protein